MLEKKPEIINFADMDFSNPLVLKNSPFRFRRIPVIVTIANSEITEVDVQKMLEAGMNVAKFKLSSSSRGDKIRLLAKLEKAILACCAKYSVTHWPIATCIELKTCIVKTGLLDGAGKPFYISGGLFENALKSGNFIDCEISDVTNALIDGASGLILKDCYDTEFTIEVLKGLNELCYTVEPLVISKTNFRNVVDKIQVPVNAAEATVISCATIANQTNARVIIVPTYDAMDLPGQQLPASYAYTSLDHILNLDVKAPAACQRLTGIIATMGKSTNDIDIMEKMMSAGMNIALLNLSFGNREVLVETIKMLREAAKNLSIKLEKNYPLAIAAKLPGKKIRTGCIAESYGGTVELIAGEVVRLTTDETYKDRCSTYTVYVDFIHFAEQMSKGNYVLLDNETIQLKVEMISSTTLTCKIERGGLLGSNKDVFVPNVNFDMPNYSETDKMFINMAVQNQLDILVASFVNSANAITELRHLMGEKGKKIAIVANIQTVEGFRNFDDILSIANGIMFTRQELGSDITPKKLVIAQKNIIARANKANVPICVSAHLLSNMRYNEIPLRSELLDIANCVLDGADALVLSAETAVGLHPVETVACMASTCKEAEACMWTKQVFYDFIDKTNLPCDQITGTALAAAMAAHRSLAAAIIVVTTSGKSAQVIAKYRPRCPIIALTRYGAIARQLHLWRGIIPLIYESEPAMDWQTDLQSRVNFCTKWAMEQGFIRIGDPIILVSGWRQGSGFTNTMRFIYATADMAN
ncbi:unnamed protein product, partial [Brenthis ino]